MTGPTGAVLALFSGIVLDWRSFELSRISATGFELPPTGQVVMSFSRAGELN